MFLGKSGINSATAPEPVFLGRKLIIYIALSLKHFLTHMPYKKLIYPLKNDTLLYNLQGLTR